MPRPGPERHDLRRIRVSTFVKFLIPLLSIVGLAVGLSGLWNYLQNKESHRKEVAERLRMVAATLAASITPAEVDALQNPDDDRQPAYGRITKMLRRSRVLKISMWFTGSRSAGTTMWKWLAVIGAVASSTPADIRNDAVR